MHTRRREHAAQRHLGHERRDDQRHHRLQVAGTGAHEVALRAARREHHAVAEHHAADQVRQPDEALAPRQRTRRIDAAGVDEDHRAGRGHRGREQPHHQPPGAAEAEPVRQRAHRAEARGLRRRAECEADREPAPDHGLGGVGRTQGEGHDVSIEREH
jgi:hypothetical protein